MAYSDVHNTMIMRVTVSHIQLRIKKRGRRQLVEKPDVYNNNEEHNNNNNKELVLKRNSFLCRCLFMEFMGHELIHGLDSGL